MDVESLNAEIEQVNGKRAAPEQIKDDKAVRAAQAARLQKAIAMLSGEPTVRNSMSDEG